MEKQIIDVKSLDNSDLIEIEKRLSLDLVKLLTDWRIVESRGYKETLDIIWNEMDKREMTKELKETLKQILHSKQQNNEHWNDCKHCKKESCTCKDA